MVSTRKTALDGLYTALGTVAGVTLDRNRDLPTTSEDLGGSKQWLIMRDGEPEEIEQTFSPAMYWYEHEVEIEGTVLEDADLEAEVDTLLAAISTAVNADTTLGGSVDYVELSAPQDTEDEPTGDGHSRGFVVIATLMYGTTDPLN